MERRLLFAVLLSIAFLFTWGVIAPRLFPEIATRPEPGSGAVETTVTPIETDVTSPTPQQRLPETPEPAAAAAEPDASLGSVSPATAPEAVVIERPEYRATFRNRGAQLVSFELKRHRTGGGSLVDLVESRDQRRIDFPFALVSADAQWNRHVNSALWQTEHTKEAHSEIVTFRLQDPRGGVISKTFRFSPDWPFEFEISTQRSDLPYRVVVGPGIRARDETEQASTFSVDGHGLVMQEDSISKVDRNDVRSIRIYGGAELVGLQDNYFVTVLRPQVAGEATLKPVEIAAAHEEGETPVTERELYAGLNDRGGMVRGTALFLPKDADLLDRFGLEDALNLGFFGLIARGLLIALQWIYKYTLNYGWAIVLLTIGIKLLLYPLQHKSMVSMKRMQKLQPKMNAIKDKYKKARSDMEQRQKMNQEMMQLYQREGINPMSGCFPILLQLPILWAFYSLLSTAIELRGAEWILWIQDLSAKDPYYITPLLMTVTMFIQQALTPMTGDPMQRRIFLLMPIIFGWIFKEFPSGLVLYWLVQNVLTIIQQLIMNKYWKEHPEQLASARA